MLELHVFISSPADCLVERDRVEALLHELNASPEARQHGICLKPLRWENLPPGDTGDKDYQRRIDLLLERAGLDRFEIYVGFMRRRPGSPTPRHASGTIEEFEIALRQRRQRGVPAEVMFYFLARPEDESESVAAFRTSLESRGFLYAQVRDPLCFEARLREHLRLTVVSWRSWRNRLRRFAHRGRALAIGSLALTSLAYLGFEVATIRQIEADIRSGAQESALQTWHVRARHMPVSRLALRDRIDATLVDVASRRLASSLLAQDLDPFTWKAAHLHAFEAQALATYGRRQLAGQTGKPRVTENARMRLVWAVMAEDWSAVRHWASTFAAHSDQSGLNELKGFVRRAPSNEVVTWLQAELPVPLAPHIAGAVLDAVAARDDTAVTFEAMQAIRDGRMGDNADRFDTPLSCAPPGQLCAEAGPILARWLRDVPGKHLPRNALAQLFDWSVPETVPAQDRLLVEQRAISMLAQKEFSDISPALIRYIARSGSPGGRQAIAARLSEHTTGRLGFGLAERAALLDTLPVAGVNAGTAALAIAKRSTDETASLSGSSFALSDASVQAAYLRWLARSGARDWPRHRGWVRQLVERTLLGGFPSFTRPLMNDAFTELVARTDSADFMDLFGEVRVPVVDSLDGRLSERRAFLLGLVQPGSQLLNPGVVNAVCRSVPALESTRPAFYRALALAPASLGRECLKSHLSDDPSVLQYLADAGDHEALLEALRRHNAGESTLPAPKILDAAGSLQGAALKAFVDSAEGSLAASELPLLWPLAVAVGTASARLIDPAETTLAQSSSALKVAAAITFLDAVVPGRVWRNLVRPEVSPRFVAMMQGVDTFDWVTVAQALPDLPADAPPATLDLTLAARRVLTVFEARQVTLSAMPSDRLMSAYGRVVGNPLWRLRLRYASDAHSARLLLQQIDDLGTVDTLGELSEPMVAFRAYLVWLLADAVARFGTGEVPESMLTAWVADTEALSSRSFAGLTLAAMKTRQAGATLIETKMPSPPPATAVGPPR